MGAQLSGGAVGRARSRSGWPRRRAGTRTAARSARPRRHGDQRVTRPADGQAREQHRCVLRQRRVARRARAPDLGERGREREAALGQRALDDPPRVRARVAHDHRRRGEGLERHRGPPPTDGRAGTATTTSSSMNGIACRGGPGSSVSAAAMPNSARPSSTSSRTRIELPTTSSTDRWRSRRRSNSTSGWGSTNSAIVWLAARRMGASSRPKPAISSSSASAWASSLRASRYRRVPAAVGVTPRGERSSSVAPASPSSVRRRLDSAGWLTRSSRAARPRLPRSTAAQKARSSEMSGARTGRPMPLYSPGASSTSVRP